MLPSTYLRITRASAVYDIVQVLPFLTPWTFALFYGQVSRLNVWLGAASLAPLTPLHAMLGTLLGTLVLLWSVFRLGTPSRRLGRFDAIGRLVFAFWIAWTMGQAALPVLWVFLLPELVWGVLEAQPLQPLQKRPRRQAIGIRTSRAAFTSAAPMRSRRGG